MLVTAFFFYMYSLCDNMYVCNAHSVFYTCTSLCCWQLGMYYLFILFNLCLSVTVADINIHVTIGNIHATHHHLLNGTYIHLILQVGFQSAFFILLNAVQCKPKKYTCACTCTYQQSIGSWGRALPHTPLLGRRGAPHTLPGAFSTFFVYIVTGPVLLLMLLP